MDDPMIPSAMGWFPWFRRSWWDPDPIWAGRRSPIGSLERKSPPVLGDPWGFPGVFLGFDGMNPFWWRENPHGFVFSPCPSPPWGTRALCYRHTFVKWEKCYTMAVGVDSLGSPESFFNPQSFHSWTVSEYMSDCLGWSRNATFMAMPNFTSDRIRSGQDYSEVSLGAWTSCCTREPGHPMVQWAIQEYATYSVSYPSCSGYSSRARIFRKCAVIFLRWFQNASVKHGHGKLPSKMEVFSGNSWNMVNFPAPKGTLC